MDSRTIALDSKDLEGGIEALSSAARAFRLTRFERAVYHGLMVSVYFTAWVWITGVSLGVFEDFVDVSRETSLLIGLIFSGGVLVAIVALVLNIPLAARLYRERRRLKELGLASLSKSLWK